jgi:hypothetical protein
MRKKFLFMAFLIFAFFPATQAQESCSDLYTEWYECLSDEGCRFLDKQFLYWELIANGCYLPPVY